MGKWMETAVNILMLFTTGTSVLFVIMYILAKNPETKAAVKQREDSLIIAAIMSIVLSLVTMNIFIIYDEMDFLMQISEYTKLVISVLFFECLIADPKPGKRFCRHRWRRTGFEEKLEHGISYSMRTYECTKCDKVMTVDGRFDKVQKKAYHERPGRRESSDDDRIGKVNIQSLRNRLLLLGSAAVKDFTGREAAGTRRQDINYLLDDAIRKMPPEQLKRFIKKYGCDIRETGPYYLYTGPDDTRNSTWSNSVAYNRGTQMAHTGSIFLMHQDISMLCRVTNRPEMPGFIITCKDNEGGEREVQIYLNNDGHSLRVCTGGLTNISADDKDQINLAYKIPFENKQEEK